MQTDGKRWPVTGTNQGTSGGGGSGTPPAWPASCTSARIRQYPPWLHHAATTSVPASGACRAALPGKVLSRRGSLIWPYPRRENISTQRSKFTDMDGRISVSASSTLYRIQTANQGYLSRVPQTPYRLKLAKLASVSGHFPTVLAKRVDSIPTRGTVTPLVGYLGVSHGWSVPCGSINYGDVQQRTVRHTPACSGLGERCFPTVIDSFINNDHCPTTLSRVHLCTTSSPAVRVRSGHGL